MSVSTLVLALPIGATFLVASPLDLAWDAPAECPDASVIEHQVHQAVGTTERERPLVAIGSIARSPDATYKLELTIVGDEAAGTRELTAKSCEDLADASVLIIAIAIDPRAIERLGVEHQPNPPPKPLPEPVPPPATMPAPTDREPRPATPALAVAPAPDEAIQGPVPPPTTTPPRGPLHVEVVLAPGVALGILPAPAGWFAAGLGLSGRLWRVELDGNISTPSRQSASGVGAVNGEFLQWAIAARGCPVVTRGDVEFPLCLGVEAGSMRGQAIAGVALSRSAAAPWAGAFGGAGAIWRPAALKQRFAFGVRAEGIAALTRPAFATQQSNLVFRAGAGGGRFAAVLSIRLR